MLWCLADRDMLNPDNYYRLRDTGQGLNRVQVRLDSRFPIRSTVYQTMALPVLPVNF